MEIGQPRGDDVQLHHAVVKKRVINNYWKTTGVAIYNTLTDSTQYEVQYLDLPSELLTANIIVGNLLDGVDEEVNMKLLLSHIVYHRDLDDNITQ